MSASLRVSSVSKSYGGLKALDRVSFSIREGEVLGLIGPNGAGKTTLFECLAGVMPHSSGTVLQDDREIAPRERHTRLFYMPDGIAPWPAQTVAWALDYAIGLFGGQAERRASVIAELGLEPLLGVRIGQLSKGQRKRALLGIGLLTPQPVLLVDEPFDGLDLRQSRELASTLRGHATSGRTLFLSIHQISDAEKLCDRFVLLSDGKVRGEGILDELRAKAKGGTDADDRSPSASSLEEVFLALT